MKLVFINRFVCEWNLVGTIWRIVKTIIIINNKSISGLLYGELLQSMRVVQHGIAVTHFMIVLNGNEK